MKSIPKIPTATYRLQFNQEFTFKQARKIVPYLHALGISHVYASPFLRAGPGSMHGYDICDHNELNPEVGTHGEFDAYVAELHAHGMGQIMDFVPNHMGIATSINTWWMDVLENGPGSALASHFDIDWHPLKSDLVDKVLLPILGDHYGRVLERGELKVVFEGGTFFLHYFDKRLPLTPRSHVLLLKPALGQLRQKQVEPRFELELESIIAALENLPRHTDASEESISARNREKEITKQRLARLKEDCAATKEALDEALEIINGTVGDTRSFDALDEVLNAQFYRLSYWRVASEEINYRRFFDINDLAAIRMELPEVFEATHRFIFELIKEGSLNGLRIDHVDGLWQPRTYLEQLQNHAAECLPGSGTDLPMYLVVEKILLGEEHLRTDWPVHGTTGYDFTNEVSGLFVSPVAERSITETYHKFIGTAPRLEDIVYEKKQLVMRLSLASEVNLLGFMLDRLSEKNRNYRDFTLDALTTAMREIIACFPIYRTYIEPGGEPSEAGREAILKALRMAKRRNPGVERSIFNFIGELLLMKFSENIGETEREERTRFVMKLQQCAGPVMAKGVEDTTFYIYNRLAALNEVGGEPNQFGLPVQKFYERCIARQAAFPQAMLATSTHDTKRSEDVRTRMAAISEIPTRWRKSLHHWRTVNRRYQTKIEGEIAPDANEEYLLYQTLLGSWPLTPMSKEGRETYIQRIQDYMIKAIKEAKINSSWIQPNEEWEAAVREFVRKILRAGPNRFLKDFEPTAAEIAQLGAINSLAQVVLKSTAPGMPDFYQGTEIWDFSLVDPDNRRQVNYESRRQMLESLQDADPDELLKNWTDGRIKLFVTQRLLAFRRDHASLFGKGEFIPLETTGTYAESSIAFLRRKGSETLLIVVPRQTVRIGFPPIGEAWRDTAISLPGELIGMPWKSLFDNATPSFAEGQLKLSAVLEKFPAAVWTAE